MQLNKAVDNLCLYDPEFKHIADRFLAEVGSGSAVHEVKTMNERAMSPLNENATPALDI